VEIENLHPKQNAPTYNFSILSFRFFLPKIQLKLVIKFKDNHKQYMVSCGFLLLKMVAIEVLDPLNNIY
jgi:hypothetical protein